VEEGVVRKGPPLIRAGLLFLLLLGSLTLVVWRQSQALEMQRALESVRRERALAESERAALLRRVEHLESRARVSEAAASRLDMRMPSGMEIVILPLAEPSAPLLAAREAAREAAAVPLRPGTSRVPSHTRVRSVASGGGGHP
jgi:cell division protein FtsL